MDFKNTMMFSLKDGREAAIRSDLKKVYGALKEKGYNPKNQLVGYLLTGDPTYITSSVRPLMNKIDRHELLGFMVESYLGK
jgi:uncharacterized protein (UPF0297 family)